VAPGENRAPGVLSGVGAQPAGQIDFAPTVLALLGIDPAPPVQCPVLHA